ncbi:aspartate/glutamate racemase family protein [Psychromarinibacter sp. C21-152]|uniref:Aspartate/glutamate racemase family protein n=1 Tax=Psychromarinibacter sediminicola TaxID=3033385 RepID=A0AAE3NYD0_9RHOB|nr:aspartate/glutamate racemase family protein [Psychromarinibacter sediminicola]MDF0603210.1 aspartate/glutamate racemase family protein [Psychromarinibacter sediminicola]
MGSTCRVHIITPIISEGFRDDSALHEAIDRLCEVTSGFLDKGPASVESAVDEVLAAPGVVDAAIRAEQDGADALVIDCMLDPGIEAAREAVSIPVIGCGEAGIAAAAEHGRFSVVTVLQRQAPLFRSLARRHGLAADLASVRGIGVPVLELDRDKESAILASIREARAALEEDGADAIVFGCTGMLGFGAGVSRALDGAPVIDPLPYAVRLAAAVVKGEVQREAGDHPVPERKPVAGFSGWPALEAAVNSGEGE